jgi:hypothetical protein
LLQLRLQLSADGGLAGTGIAANELCGERLRCGFGQGAVVQRYLSGGVAGLHAQVVPVQYQQLLPDDEPQPEVERHGRVTAIVVVPRPRLDERILDHIRGVDAPLQPAIEPQLHHANQPLAVQREFAGQ